MGAVLSLSAPKFPCRETISALRRKFPVARCSAPAWIFRNPTRPPRRRSCRARHRDPHSELHGQCCLGASAPRASRRLSRGRALAESECPRPQSYSKQDTERPAFSVVRGGNERQISRRKLQRGSNSHPRGTFVRSGGAPGIASKACLPVRLVLPGINRRRARV